MINRVTKKVVKEVEETISEQFVCDVCGKTGEYKERGNVHWEEVPYYSIFTGHRDWGNDSCESENTTQVCCTECLLKVFTDWLNDEDFKYSDTAYISIEKDTHVRKKAKNNG